MTFASITILSVGTLACTLMQPAAAIGGARRLHSNACQGHAQTGFPSDMDKGRARGSSELDVTLSDVRPFNGVVISPGGNMISYCSSTGGCIPRDGPAGVAPDHMRASLLVGASTMDDGHSQENTLGLETTIGTGEKTGWAPNTTYAPKANVTTAAGYVYRAQATCSSGTLGGPTGTGTAIADGTCRWDWINSSNLNAKVGFFNSVNVVPGAGPSWGSSEDVVIRPGARPGIVTNKELDVTNLGAAAGIGSGPVIFGLNIGMTGNASTAGLQIGANQSSNPGTLFGLWLTGRLSTFSDLEDDANSPVGIGFNITGLGSPRTTADIQSRSASPQFILDTGAHGVAAINLDDASPAGLLIGNRHTMGQIIGQGWSVDLSGNLNAQGVVAGSEGVRLPQTVVASLPSCSPTTKGTLYGVTDAVAPTYNGRLTGGGSTAIPAYCDGTAWTAH